MKTQELKRDLLVWMGTLLEYPKEDQESVLPGVVIERLFPHEQATVYLREFFAHIDAMGLGARQEHYVRTFDVIPLCSLYLSVHLFGEESFKRSELMTGFKAIYDKHPSVEITELPDHLGVVLEHNDWFEQEEWQDLVEMCILPALPKMIDKLEQTRNPYAFVLKAIRVLLLDKEMLHA